MPHFFISTKNIIDNVISITEKENINHISKALRMKQGEEILLIDENRIQYEGQISNIDKNLINIEILKKYPSKNFLRFNLSLAQSPLRSEKQALLIEKATELGVNNIYPIFTDNCSLKKSVIEQKIDKWQKIMAESSKQCERATIPTCQKLTTLKELVEGEIFDRIIAFTERRADFIAKDYLINNPIKDNEKILAIIGPEGGFSHNEFEYLNSNDKITTLSLGNLILRAETATIVALGSLVL